MKSLPDKPEFVGQKKKDRAVWRSPFTTNQFRSDIREINREMGA